MKTKTGLFGYRPPVRLELKEGVNQTKFRREINVLLDKIRHGNSDEKKYARKKLKEEYGITVYNQHEKARYVRDRQGTKIEGLAPFGFIRER